MVPCCHPCDQNRAFFPWADVLAFCITRRARDAMTSCRIQCDVLVRWLRSTAQRLNGRLRSITASGASISDSRFSGTEHTEMKGRTARSHDGDPPWRSRAGHKTSPSGSVPYGSASRESCWQDADIHTRGPRFPEAFTCDLLSASDRLPQTSTPTHKKLTRTRYT